MSGNALSARSRSASPLQFRNGQPTDALTPNGSADPWREAEGGAVGGHASAHPRESGAIQSLDTEGHTLAFFNPESQRNVQLEEPVRWRQRSLPFWRYKEERLRLTNQALLPTGTDATNIVSSMYLEFYFEIIRFD